jgi:hypothetical protein
LAGRGFAIHSLTLEDDGGSLLFRSRAGRNFKAPVVGFGSTLNEQHHNNAYVLHYWGMR